ncbi:hypothetical protein BVRB_4g071670 [Beta vulgaris subsp. vulgaris]|nr:hypothetical protein BVRB_4g071670 [Beta vulgaris subsp. vulgaris]
MCDLLKRVLLKVDAFIGNMLVVAYAKTFDLLNDAQKLFDEIPKRMVSSQYLPLP